MNKLFLGLGVFVLIGAAIWWYAPNKLPPPTPSQQVAQDISAGEMDATSTTMGTYAYECDEHVTFTMTPAPDMSSIRIEPLNNPAYPKAVTLQKQPSPSGVRYESEETTFIGKGESVSFTQGDFGLNCSPVPDTENAPFNFGD